MLRLVSAEDVKDIICKHESRSTQQTMIYEVEKLKGCIATDEQMVQILADDNIEFED